jgi:LPS sulfotransferase NodH/SAM-dependent methyltransferase
MTVAVTRGATQGKTDGQRRRAKGKVAKPIVHLTDARLDFRRTVPLRKSYIVASSYRCGSTFLCKELWSTGLLGAPWEYFNPRKSPSTNSIQDTMMERLKASSIDDYVAKLIACRTTRNGVFGMKAHFHDFETTLKKYPGLLEALAPITYIFMDRRNKLAQAVSMARAMQTNSWISLAKADTAKLHYDRDLISKCLGKHEMQRLGWQRWFDANDINPFVVFYEELESNPAGVVRSVIEYLDVQDDDPNNIRLPPIEKQSDDINDEWVARFEREVEAGVVTRETDSVTGREEALVVETNNTEPSPNRDTAVKQSPNAHFFERYDRFVEGKQPRSLRQRYRYEAMIARNRALFENARVLDIASGDGVWSLAALDAGAARVVGVEPRRQRVDAAQEKFTAYGISPEAFKFVNSQIFEALRKFGPDEFDLVLCTGFFEQADPRFLFDQLSRLRAKHVILDTAIVPGLNPVVRFVLRPRSDSAPKTMPLSASIVSTPSHELVALFCDIYGFRWEAVDPNAMGVTDWTGFRDYERGRRRTYVLERAA